MKKYSEFETWYKYDIEYIENWSLYLDLKLFLKHLCFIYKKIKGILNKVGRVGIEPTTLSLKGSCSTN